MACMVPVVLKIHEKIIMCFGHRTVIDFIGERHPIIQLRDKMLFIQRIDFMLY